MNTLTPTTPTSPAKPGQAGSLTVEMALVLPILLTLLLGILELGNILRIQATLESAVGKIARYAATQETSQASAQNYMQSQGLVPQVQQPGSSDGPQLTLSPSTTAPCSETPCLPFEVSLEYTYYAMSPPMKPFFDNIKLSASAKKMSEDWGQ
ncbi:TadE/TadG family type IV pilus assembly protein [Solidesulfovibrio carbinolicus]|uniref:Pilus assembly protein TadE n=1 Tax=Solidesulfovibrio carbinolicus TaxID=296842 RepID=A0A4P6HHX8_9BACT|nr:TadE/TadG family type IV pilus assembly protein [Solidesulfovibrio carbinolicus]QAZ66637.1 pilus assembly protein TadE [Solidesulfovibrio carbinolicus]